MSERSDWIVKLDNNADSFGAYVRGKLDVLVPAQIHSLRLNRKMKQKELARVIGMKQSRISAMETPGAVNFNLETLVRVAAGMKLGLKVEFVPLSGMLTWEHTFDPQIFNPAPILEDINFLNWGTAVAPVLPPDRLTQFEQQQQPTVLLISQGTPTLESDDSEEQAKKISSPIFGEVINNAQKTQIH
jgi:transcriptional regulator with XRE-family HTH domain